MPFNIPFKGVQMWLIALLAAVGAAAALPRHVRNANWAALPGDVQEDNLELIFVNALWRHGDRSGEHPVPGGDQFTEDDWTLGGGGYGELTPLGMKMHFELGRKLRDRYMNETEFLSTAYNAREIYIRSTDYNRTLISAYANVQGMFSGNGESGQNYPDDVDEWPTGYVPIPVHTVNKDSDFVGHPDSKCDRQDQLYEMVRQSPEYQKYQNDPQVSQILKYLADQTNTEVNIDNVYDIQDPIFCEGAHIDTLNQTGANIADFYPWFYAGDVPSWVDWIIDQDEDFTNGIGNAGGVNGIDMSIEIPKIRAGETLKTVAGNVNGVLACIDDKGKRIKQNADTDACRHFYEKLKYYAISAHDTTLDAFLTILGVKKYTIPEGYPNYSAAILVEVYQDNTTYEKYFKVLYHAGDVEGNPGAPFVKPITAFVRGCDFKNNYCPIAVLNDLVTKYAYDGDMATLCATPPNGVPPTTTVKPVDGASTTTSTTSTTTKSPTTTTTPQNPTTTSSVPAISFLFAFVVMLTSALL